MSSEYIDTILVECDRSSATIKNEDDPSTWINQQNNPLLLLPNDKVSVYSSYINDIGSGQEAPIEFRGKRLNKTKTIQVINQTDYVEICGNILESINYITYTTDQLQDLVIENKDNEANMVINFYKTMDLKNYIQCPRRFITTTTELSSSLIDDQKRWAQLDSLIMGRTHVETPYIDPTTPFPGENAGFGYVPQDIRGFPSFQQDEADDLEFGDVVHWILRNDNSRYTIMKKLNNVNPDQPNLNWTTDKLSQSRKDSFSHHPPYYAREPEYFQYKMVREHINLKADVGFNAASSVAKKLSQDLQATKENPREDFQHKRVETAPDIYLDFVLNKTLESKTYQQINVGSEELQQKDYYLRALFNGPTATLADMTNPSTDGLPGVLLESYIDPDIGETWRVTDVNELFSSYYYNGYRYIACKRPEIYESGTELNDIFGLEILDDMLEANRFTQGMPLRLPYFETDDGTFDGVILEPRRPSAKLLQFKAFIESQELYPDLWSQQCVEKILDPLLTNYYNIYPRAGGGGSIYYSYININNSRFAHMNTFVLQKDHGAPHGIHEYDFANSDVFEQDRNRFVNPFDAFSPVKNEYIKLGNSYYDYRGSHREADSSLQMNRELNSRSQSRPFFFHYDPDQKDEFHLEPVTLNDIANEKWSYGCFGLTGDYGYGFTNGVVVYPSALTYDKETHANEHDVGLPLDYYSTFYGGTGLGTIKINQGTKAGFDRHWNAWATAVICLNSGKGLFGYPNSQFIEHMTAPHRAQAFPGMAGSGLATPTDTIPIFPMPVASKYESVATDQLMTTTYNNKMYIGADSPKLDFDGSYFHFKDLHTALNKGNLKMVDPLVNTSFEESDGGKIVYKINPTQEYDQYTPVQYPYNRSSEYFIAGTTDARQLTRMNFNAEALTIYDTTTGIFIADWGFNKDSWNEGLWARLGFSYEQFHSSVLSRLERVNLNNISDLNIVTTNASIDCVDTKSWEQDQFGITTFSGAPLVNQTIQVANHAHAPPKVTDARTIRWIPPIYQSTESVKIQAQNYPISMFNGYYSIRSDIVGDSSFVDGTGNTAMPIVSIISKQSPAGDFYITPESDIQFTITKPTRLSSVSVSITEPDGTPAPISERSSVIFKLQRTRTLNTQLAREVFEQFAEKNKKSVYSPKM